MKRGSKMNETFDETFSLYHFLIRINGIQEFKGWTLVFLLENLIYCCTRVVKDWPVLLMSCEHASKNISQKLYVQEIQNSSKNYTTAKLQTMSKITRPSTRLYPSTSTVPLSYRQHLYRSRGYHSAFHLIQGNLNYNSYIRYRYHIRPSKTRKQINRKASGDRTSHSAETSTHGIIFPPKDGTNPRTPPFGGVTSAKESNSQNPGRDREESQLRPRLGSISKAKCQSLLRSPIYLCLLFHI
jgi:hypothetical protein